MTVQRQTDISFFLGPVDHLREFLGDDGWWWGASEVWVCCQQFGESVQTGEVQAVLLIDLLRVCSRKDGDAIWAAEFKVYRFEVGVDDRLENGVWGRLYDHLRLGHSEDVQRSTRRSVARSTC